MKLTMIDGRGTRQVVGCYFLDFDHVPRPMSHAAEAAPVAQTRTVSAAYLKRYRNYGKEQNDGNWPVGGLALRIIKRNVDEVRIGGKELPSNVLYLVPYSLDDGASREIAALLKRLESSIGCASLIPPRWVALDRTLGSVWEFWNGLRTDYADEQGEEYWSPEACEGEQVYQSPVTPTVEEETAAGVLKLLSGGVSSSSLQSSPIRHTDGPPKARQRRKRRTITLTRYNPLRKKRERPNSVPQVTPTAATERVV